jgi:hypothetical protein
MRLRATGEVLTVDIKESRPGVENPWRLAVVRILVGRADFVDVVMMENQGRYAVTLPDDGDQVDYWVDVNLRKGKGDYGPSVGVQVVSTVEGAALSAVL